MNHEQAFFQAIRDEPDDDTHRLIYADWLEEQGGAARAARAAFIRAQCRLAVLPAGDPARDPLEDEAADLLAEYEDEWTQPLRGIAEQWQFARGFVESISLRGENFLTHAERLFDFAPVRAVHLLIHFRDVPHLAACPSLHWVEQLDFRRCHLHDRALQQLLTSPHLDRLTALHLAGNGITTAGVQALVRSPLLGRLRHLDLSRNAGVGDRAVHLLAGAPAASSLEELGLASTNATATGLEELFRSLHLPRLVKLDISGKRFALAQLASWMKKLAESRLLSQLRSLDLSEAIDPLALPLLILSPAVANLRELHLRGIGLEGDDVAPLAESPYLEGLNVLDLRKNNLRSEGARALAGSPHLVGLISLDISSNNIRDTGATAIAESSCLKRLSVLDLARNGIGGPGLQSLAASVNLGHLRTLNLAGNFIGGDSVRTLAESSHLGRLVSLDLSDAYLEEDSGRALASSANLPRLATLRLQKNLLGDGGAKALAHSPHLKRLTILNLNDNRIGKAGAEALSTAPLWRHLRELDLRGNVFTDTQEALLRSRFGAAVLL